MCSTVKVMEEKVHAYKDQISELAHSLPEVVQAYHQFTGECFASGALDAKTKQLIALGIGMFANNEVCTFYHVNEARSKGASEQEIMETIAVAGAVGGGHAMSQGALRVQEAIKQ